jgi:hypothetical protein
LGGERGPINNKAGGRSRYRREHRLEDRIGTEGYVWDLGGARNGLIASSKGRRSMIFVMLLETRESRFPDFVFNEASASKSPYQAI